METGVDSFAQSITRRIIPFGLFWWLEVWTEQYFCLRPSAKGQGITWVVVVLVLVLHHLVHFLFKRNLSKKISLTEHWTRVHMFHSQVLIHWATESYLFLKWKLIPISRRRPWTSIGGHLFFYITHVVNIDFLGSQEFMNEVVVEPT